MMRLCKCHGDGDQGVGLLVVAEVGLLGEARAKAAVAAVVVAVAHAPRRQKIHRRNRRKGKTKKVNGANARKKMVAALSGDAKTYAKANL